MKEKGLTEFDPFSSRLARDIRNGLSDSFLQALVEKDSTVYQEKIEEYLAQNLKRPYQEYIAERLRKYDVVIGIVTHEGSNDKMQQAGILWSHKLYFEMHELLEEFWVESTGERRRGLQGLIRAAGMKIHAENNNIKAAVSMGMKARTDLDKYGTSLADFAELEAVSAEINHTLAELTSEK
jgi:hypothetical protein